MAQSPYFEGQEFYNENDPSAPTLVFSKSKGFVRKDDYVGAKQRNQAAFDDAHATVREVDHAANKVGVFGATGAIGAALSAVPGMAGYDLAHSLAPVQARLRLQNLARMKANSPNGASGMGSLTEGEGKALQSTEGALDVGLNAPELRRSLVNIKRAQQLQTRGLSPDNAYDLGRGDDAGTIPQGALFRGPDGKLYTNTRSAGWPGGAGAAPATATKRPPLDNFYRQPEAPGWSIRKVN